MSEMEIRVNDKVEIISTSYLYLYGEIATVLDIKEDALEKALRIRTDSGVDVWIDAQDVVLWAKVSK
ncbi:hypothetical protein ABNF65_16220 [Paenibacillus larvae]